MRIVFMGTPDIAVASLASLLQNGHKAVGVFTREDKPIGRKQIISSPPVKTLALENNIPIFQPRTLRDPAIIEELRELAPELIVVVAYGMLLPPEVLQIPTHGCINMHVSLLPKYRGAAPIQWAVINGETETGITIMEMDEGLDTGPIYAQQKVGISPEATAGDVFDLVTRIGSRLLCDTVEKIEKGTAVTTPQEGESSRAPRLTKEAVTIDFSRTAKELHSLVRGCNPWPLAWFNHNKKRIKVTRAKISDEVGEVGIVVSTTPLTIGCGENSLVLEYVVPEGGRPMAGAEWAAGRRFKAGDSILESN